MGNTAPPSMDTTSTTLLSQLMVAVIIGTFFIIALLFFLHLYVKCYWSRNSEDPNTVAWRRRAAAAATTTRNGGLQPLALRSLPVVEFNPKDFKDGLECAVCLSELSQGEKARILPKCNHGFHVGCIDMWFQCHSTCPLCRTNVVSGQNPTSLNPNSTGANNNVDDHQEVVNTSLGSSDHNHGSFRIPVFPTNVLFWGDETQVRSLGVPLEEGHDVNNTNTSSLASTSGEDHGLVIEIPSGELCEDCSCSSPKGNKSPVMTRLRSLKRLLSREKRLAMAPSPRGSSSGDVEHV